MSAIRIINYSANIKELLLIHRKNWLSLNGNFVADFFTILAGLNVFKEGEIEYYFKDFKLSFLTIILRRGEMTLRKK